MPKENPVNPILQHFAAPDHVEVAVGEHVFRFRSLKRADDLSELDRKARQYVVLLESPRCPTSWKPYLPVTERVARMCCYVKELSDDPRLTDIDVLWMAANNGVLLAHLYASIADANTAGIARVEQEVWDELGEL